MESNNIKIILLGATGFVGQNVLKVFNENGVEVIAASKTTSFNLLDLQSTIDFFKRHNPDYIINCAAHVGSLNYVSIISY